MCACVCVHAFVSLRALNVGSVLVFIWNCASIFALCGGDLGFRRTHSPLLWNLIPCTGYHNYLIYGFVSCSCKGLLGPQQSVVGAQLKIKISRVDGKDPFTAFPVKMKADMVRGFASPCTPTGTTFPHRPLPPLPSASSTCIVMWRCRRPRASLAKQAFAFNGNPLLETADWGAAADFPNMGTVSGLATSNLGGAFLTVTLSPAAATAINCSHEIQFRLMSYNTSNGFPFTNFDMR